MPFFSKKKSEKTADRVKDGTPTKVFSNGSTGAPSSAQTPSRSTSQQLKPVDQLKAGVHLSQSGFEAEKVQGAAVDKQTINAAGMYRLDSFTNPEMGDLSSTSASGPISRSPEIKGSWSSQLWKSLSQVLADKDALVYLIQFLESRGAVSLVKFWLDAETFRLLNDTPGGAASNDTNDDVVTATSVVSNSDNVNMANSSTNVSAAPSIGGNTVFSTTASIITTPITDANDLNAASVACSTTATSSVWTTAVSARAASTVTTFTENNSTMSSQPVVENLGHCDTLSADLHTSLNISETISNPAGLNQSEASTHSLQTKELETPNILSQPQSSVLDSMQDDKKLGISTARILQEGGTCQRVGGVSIIAHGDSESRLDNAPIVTQTSNAGTGMYDAGMPSLRVSDSGTVGLRVQMGMETMDSGLISSSAGVGKQGLSEQSNLGTELVGVGIAFNSLESDVRVDPAVVDKSTITMGNSGPFDKTNTDSDKASTITNVGNTQTYTNNDAPKDAHIRTCSKNSSIDGASVSKDKDIVVVNAATNPSCVDINRNDCLFTEGSVVVSQDLKSSRNEGISSKESSGMEKPCGRNQSWRPSRTGVERDAVVIFSKYLSPDCSHPITISEPLRVETIRRICGEDGKVDPKCFVECQHAVFNIIDRLYFTEFLSSFYHTKHQVDLLTGPHQLHLTDIIYHDTSLGYFTEFMEAENLLPVLQCFIDLDNFEKHLLSQSTAATSLRNTLSSSPMSSGSTAGYDGMEAQSDAIVIYEKYFSLQATSQSLKFDDKVRLEIENQICREGGPLPNCFSLPRALTYSKMEQVYFPRFLKSEQYYKYLSDLINAVRQAPDDLIPYHRKRTGSDASSEKSFGSQHSSSIGGGINTLLAMDTRGQHVKDKGQSTKVSQNVNMRMDDAMFNPDNLWRRTKPGMNIGRVDDLGQFISEFDPAPDQEKLDIGRLFGKKKLKEKENEEMALQFAQRLISDITSASTGLTDDDDWSTT